MLLSPHPSLNTQESLHSFGSAWFSSCEASSASSWAVHGIFLGLISTFFIRELAAGLVPVEGVGYRGGRQSPETEEPLQKCHLLAWLDSKSPPARTGFMQLISETRLVRCGWLTDPGVLSLCSRERLAKTRPLVVVGGDLSFTHLVASWGRLRTRNRLELG